MLKVTEVFTVMKPRIDWPTGGVKTGFPPPPADPPPPPRPPPRPARAPRAMRRPAAAGLGVHQCPTCQQEFRPTDIGQHTPTCRGPGIANLQCLFCNKQFQSIQARKNHERYSHAQESLQAGLIRTIPKRAVRPREVPTDVNTFHGLMLCVPA